MRKRIAIGLVSALLGGCASAAVMGLLDSTDLSGLKKGMSASEVHEVLGKPIESKSISRGTTERHGYDRGYVNPLSKESPNLYYGLVPAFVFIDVVTFGALGACTLTCQKGWLDLTYDNRGRLVRASEQTADDGGSCWSGRRRPQCLNNIASNPKPTTLSTSLSGIVPGENNDVIEDEDDMLFGPQTR